MVWVFQGTLLSQAITLKYKELTGRWAKSGWTKRHAKQLIPMFQSTYPSGISTIECQVKTKCLIIWVHYLHMILPVLETWAVHPGFLRILMASVEISVDWTGNADTAEETETTNIHSVNTIYKYLFFTNTSILKRFDCSM